MGCSSVAKETHLNLLVIIHADYCGNARFKPLPPFKKERPFGNSIPVVAHGVCTVSEYQAFNIEISSHCAPRKWHYRVRFSREQLLEIIPTAENLLVIVRDGSCEAAFHTRCLKFSPRFEIVSPLAAT